MSDFRFNLINHNGIESLHVMIEAYDTLDAAGFAHAYIPIDDIQAAIVRRDISTPDATVTIIYWKRSDGSRGTFASSNDIEIKEKLDQLAPLKFAGEIRDLTIGTHPPIAASSSPEKDK